MKLYTSPTSPFGRKIRIIIREMELAIEEESLSPWAERAKLSGCNPLGKIPFLELDDGSYVFDSWVIREHLELLAPGRLLSSAGLERTQALTACAVAQGMMEAGASVVSAKLALKARLPEAVEEWHKSKILAGLKDLDVRLGRAEFGGAEIKLLDIMVACALGFLDFRLAGEIEWRADYPDLVAWLARISDRPAFRQTLPAQ